MPTQIPPSREKRKCVWMRESHVQLIKQTKRHPKISFQSAMDDLIESALRQRRLIPSTDDSQPEIATA